MQREASGSLVVGTNPFHFGAAVAASHVPPGSAFLSGLALLDVWPGGELSPEQMTLSWKLGFYQQSSPAAAVGSPERAPTVTHEHWSG